MWDIIDLYFSDQYSTIELTMNIITPRYLCLQINFITKLKSPTERLIILSNAVCFLDYLPISFTVQVNLNELIRGRAV